MGATERRVIWPTFERRVIWPTFERRVIWPTLMLVIAWGSGCATGKPALRAELTPLALARGKPAQEMLVDDHFKRDRPSGLKEADLKRILDAPVIFKEGARMGVVRVADHYGADETLPLAVVPGELTEALEESAVVGVATEVSTEWPAARGLPGLRELAARYRSEYLLLYRHRFVNRSYTNAWGWLYLTVVGTLMVPSHTLESAGVLEASLFDVRTGTILFTVFERVAGSRKANIWYNDLKQQALRKRLLRRAATRLAEKVVAKAQRLVADNPRVAVAQGGTARLRKPARARHERERPTLRASQPPEQALPRPATPSPAPPAS